MCLYNKSIDFSIWKKEKEENSVGFCALFVVISESCVHSLEKKRSMLKQNNRQQTTVAALIIWMKPAAHVHNRTTDLFIKSWLILYQEVFFPYNENKERNVTMETMNGSALDSN